MYMPLVAAEDGIVQFIKQIGVTLAPGDILGILTLDDPARVKHAKPFEGILPALGMPSVVGNKPHQRFQHFLTILNDTLDGFDNQAIMISTLKDLIESLHDVELPYSEMTATMSSIAGRIPPKLEENIRNTVAGAKTMGTEFPAMRLKKLIQNYIQENVRPAEEAMFRTQITSVLDIVERYLQGLKEHEVVVFADLLARYEQTECLFNGSIEAKVLELRQEHKDDLSKVVSLVRSHAKTQNKGQLVMALLDHVRSSGLIISNPESRMYRVLQSLAALEAKYVWFFQPFSFFLILEIRASTGVALKAREVLIACQMPSYDERLHQMGEILKASLHHSFYGQDSGTKCVDSTIVTNTIYSLLFRAPSVETLRELIDSRYTVFDVLPHFFNYQDNWVILGQQLL